MTITQENNLRTLKNRLPGLFEYVSSDPGFLKSLSLPQDNSCEPLIDINTLRATTLVVLGIDRRLPQIIEALNGENNLIVVEEDVSNFLALISEFEHKNLFDKDKVLWILSMDMLNEVEVESFLLGNIELIDLQNEITPSLGVSVLRLIRDLFQTLNKTRELNEHTYLTMVTYNRLELTIRTLDRLLMNTVTPFQLVVVDNHSRDGTRDWLMNNKSRYPFIHRVFFLSTNLGIGRALNNGILYAMSRSKRVGRLDNDILVPPFWLRDLNHVLNSPLQPKIVGGLDTSSTSTRRYLQHAVSTLVDDLKVYLVEAVGGFCNVYDPSIFNELGFFPEYPLFGVEDGALCKAAREAKYGIAIVDNVKVEHLSTIITDDQRYKDFKSKQIEDWSHQLRESDQTEIPVLP